MRYLHSSLVRVHGFLTSYNCVIDARWVLKITDYGILSLYHTQGLTLPQRSPKGKLHCIILSWWVMSVSCFLILCLFICLPNTRSITLNSLIELLWTAPELLRDETLRRHGTQTGDVYSFAIIMQEVLVRGEPYCNCLMTLSCEGNTYIGSCDIIISLF